MANVKFKDNVINTYGDLPQIGNIAPKFQLTRTDLTEISLDEIKGKNIILNIFPSLDTPVCAETVRKFNEKAGQLNNTVILCVSADLPFAHKRFCETENIRNVINVSTFRHPEFGKDYGVVMLNGPLQGLMSRAIVLINQQGKVLYSQQVSKIEEEPDYDAVINKI